MSLVLSFMHMPLSLKRCRCGRSAAERAEGAHLGGSGG